MTTTKKWFPILYLVANVDFALTEPYEKMHKDEKNFQTRIQT